MSLIAPRGLAAIAFTAVACVAALFPPTGATAAEPEQEQEFVETGTFDRLPDDARRLLGETAVPREFDPNSPPKGLDGTIFPVHEARQLWQVYRYYDGSPKTAFAVRDMDTLGIVGSVVVEGTLQYRGTAGFGGGWLTAVDPGGRVFLMFDRFVTREIVRTLVAIDFRTFAQRDYPLTTIDYFTRGGMAYDRHADQLLMTYGGPASTTAANTITQLEALDLRSGTVVGARRIRTCDGPQPGIEGNRTYQVDPYITERYVYLPCQRAGNVGAVVRVERATLLDITSPEVIVAGPTNLETALTDHATGRIFMATIRGVVWVFDTKAMAYVGVIGGNADRTNANDMGYGLGPVTGRLYILSPAFGLGVAEGRHFPLPQAKAQPELAARGQQLLIADEKNHRLFVLRGTASEKERHYVVYRTRPAPPPPPPPDPDRNTVDQPEAAGLNESRFNAGAGGYGVRVLLANGLSTIAPAPTLGDASPTTADILINNVNAKCGFTDRELVAARVSKAEADTGSAAAEATAVHIDPRTRLDLDRPSRCEPYGKNGQDYLEAAFATAPEPYDNDTETSRWNRDPASCTTSQGDKPKASDGDDHGAAPVGANRVECPTPGEGDLRAFARASLTGPVAVERAEADVKVTRGPGRIRVTSEARAANIRIGEGIVINEIRSTAVSEATGRPRQGDMSAHTVVIRGLSIGGKRVCDVCDIEDVETLNRAVAGRAEFRLGHGSADPRLLKGSPRGALTAAQKSPERQFSDRALIGDVTAELPGLELTVFNDNSKWGRARQIYQFAGVSAATTYNIVPLPRFDGLGGLDVAGDSGDSGDSGAGGAGGGEALDGGGAFVTAPLGLDTAASDRDGGGGGVLGAIGRAVRAVARGLRLFATDPRHGLAILTGWALLGLPVLLFRRRLTVATGAEIG